MALVGVLGDCLSAIVAYDSKHAAFWTLLAALGGAIMKRGFSNTKNEGGGS